MKMKKIFIIVVILFFIINFVFCIKSFAVDNWESYIQSNYNGNATDTGGGDSFIKNLINRIIAVVQLLGIFTAIAMLVIMGMKFLLGSVEDKAEIKKHLTTYTIGAVVLFSAAGILEIVKKFVVGVTS